MFFSKMTSEYDPMVQPLQQVGYIDFVPFIACFFLYKAVMEVGMSDPS